MQPLTARNRAVGPAALMLLALAIAPAKAQTPSTDETEAAPSIRFARYEHDFGMHDAGPELETAFTFTNTGTGVLRILNVKGG